MNKIKEKKSISKTNKYGYKGEKLDFAFGKLNYILLFTSLGVLLLGYLLLSGGSSNDPNIFNYEMFNTRRMVIAPLVLLSGFIIGFFAIMKVKKD